MEEPQGCQILQYSGYFLKAQLLKWWENWRLPASGGFCFFKEFLILLLVQKKQGPGACSPCQGAEDRHSTQPRWTQAAEQWPWLLWAQGHPDLPGSRQKSHERSLGICHPPSGTGAREMLKGKVELGLDWGSSKVLSTQPCSAGVPALQPPGSAGA